MDTDIMALPLGSLDKDIIVIHVIRLSGDKEEEDTSHQHAVPGPVMPWGRPPHTGKYSQMKGFYFNISWI